MSKANNILIITHSNNDFDHFLPLLVKFKKDQSKNITSLAFYNKDELLKNQLHNYMCNKNNIQLESFTDLFGLKPLSNFMVKLYKFSLKKLKDVQYTGSFTKKMKKRIKNFLSSPVDSLIRTMYYVSKKYIVLYSIFFTKEKDIEKYFSDNNFDLAIIDLRAEELEYLNSKPTAKFKKIIKGKMKADDDIMFRFLAEARKRYIPILAIPHGPNYLTEEPIELAYKAYDSLFRADYTIHCNITGQTRDKMRLGLKKSLLLGDPRFDPPWINYVESCALDLYKAKVEKPKNKTVVLYIASFIQRHTYYDNIDYAYHNEIHKDVLSLVNHFPNIEIWMKYHPRRVYKIPIEEYVKEERQQNIKFFGNDVDTSVLMAMADVIICPMSSTLTIPILQKKPLIYYYRWKEKTGDITVTTVYDKCQFVLKAANHNELKQQLEIVLNKQVSNITDSDVAFFYKKMFTVDSPYEDMTNKYINTIDGILTKKL